MILVIGASSFIGVHTVAELLKQGCGVCVTGRNNKFKEYYDGLGVKYVNFELSNSADIKNLPSENVEGIILLAGLLPANSKVNLDTDENAAAYFELNVIATINLLEYCRKFGIDRIIATTSYADVRNSWCADRAITEDEHRGFSYKGDHAIYVISKNAMCDVLEYYNQQHGMKNAWFRFPPVYGVGPHGTLFVNGKHVKSGLQIFIDNAKTGEDIEIFGNKNLSRDVVYVKDVAHAFYLAIKSKNTYGLYNITSGKGVTLQEQAETIRDVFSTPGVKKSRIVYKPTISNNTPSFLFSVDKAKKDFGFVPEYADFYKMMVDYKQDTDNELYRELFHY